MLYTNCPNPACQKRLGIPAKLIRDICQCPICREAFFPLEENPPGRPLTRDGSAKGHSDAAVGGDGHVRPGQRLPRCWSLPKRTKLRQIRAELEQLKVVRRNCLIRAGRRLIEADDVLITSDEKRRFADLSDRIEQFEGMLAAVAHAYGNPRLGRRLYKPLAELEQRRDGLLEQLGTRARQRAGADLADRRVDVVEVLISLRLDQLSTLHGDVSRSLLSYVLRCLGRWVGVLRWSGVAIRYARRPPLPLVETE
jgi:hypothetical protein